MELIYTLEDIIPAADWLLKNLNDSKCVAVFGEMGAGKTTLINQVCRQLGADSNFSSPTFSIINEYVTHEDQSIFHIDLYRLRDEKEVITAGVEECIFSGQYCFVEWPERAEGLFPGNTVKCHFTVLDTITRKLTINL